MEDLNSQQTKQRVYERIQETIARKRRRARRIYVATASLIIITLAVVVYRHRPQPVDLTNLSADQLYADISSGSVSINGRERQSIADIKPEDQLPLHIHRDSNMLVVTSRQSNRSKDDEIILRAGIGGLYKVILDDGSIVFLNSNSELRYYGDLVEDRQVRLQGEAFFEVANRVNEQQRQPFTVHTDQQEIEVLGTQFNVVSRENQEQTVLTEGAIRLKSLKKSEENTLSPGEMVELNADGSLTKSKVPIEEYTAWKDGIIYFEDRSLMDILTELKRIYPVDFKPKQVPQKNFTVYLKRDRPLSDILAMIEQSGQLDVQLKNQEIIFSK